MLTFPIATPWRPQHDHRMSAMTRTSLLREYYVHVYATTIANYDLRSPCVSGQIAEFWHLFGTYSAIIGDLSTMFRVSTALLPSLWRHRHALFTFSISVEAK